MILNWKPFRINLESFNNFLISNISKADGIYATENNFEIIEDQPFEQSDIDLINNYYNSLTEEGENEKFLLVEQEKLNLTTLPTNPTNRKFVIDANTEKLKVWNETLNRWIIVGDSSDIVFDNSTNGFSSNNVQSAIEEAKNAIPSISHMFCQTFINVGSTGNQWLELCNTSIYSNETNFIIPFDCKLTGITFSNQWSNRDCDIEIWKANYNDGVIKSKVYTFQIRNKRTALISDNNLCELNAGDKIGIYIKDQGDRSLDVIVNLYFVTVNNESHNLSENYTGEF